MMFGHQLFEAFFEDVGINLGCRDIGVTKQLLHRAQIGAAIQEMAGEGMPQNVW